MDDALLQKIHNEQIAQRQLMERIAHKLGLLGSRQEVNRLLEQEQTERARRKEKGFPAAQRLLNQI